MSAALQCMRVVQVVVNDFYAITVGCLGERSDAPEFLTCSIKMVVSIVCYDDVCLIQSPVMTDPVLLQGLRIQDSNLHRPHARDIIQYYLITPEIPPEQQV